MRIKCEVPENIHTPPQKGLEIPVRRGGGGGGGGSRRDRNLKQCMKGDWNFRRGGGITGQIPSVGGMDIFWNHTMLHMDTMNVFIVASSWGLFLFTDN